MAPRAWLLTVHIYQWSRKLHSWTLSGDGTHEVVKLVTLEPFAHLLRCAGSMEIIVARCSKTLESIVRMISLCCKSASLSLWGLHPKENNRITYNARHAVMVFKQAA